MVFSPRLSTDGLPESEKYQAVLISDLLQRLSRELINNLTSDLDLVTFAESTAEQATEEQLALHRKGPDRNGPGVEFITYSNAVTGLARKSHSMRHWAHVATKDALLTVFHCREACILVTDAAAGTKKLRKRIRLEEAVAIRKELCDRVPNLTKLRNAVAHDGDHGRGRTEKYRASAPSITFTSAQVWKDRMVERQVTHGGWGSLVVTNNDDRMQFTLDASLVNDIEMIIYRFFACFEKASLPYGT